MLSESLRFLSKIVSQGNSVQSVAAGWLMKRLFLLTSVAAVLLAGCTGAPGETIDADATYRVPVEAGHAVNGDARTISVTVTQGGDELGSGSYSTQGKTVDDFETLFTVTATGGELKIQAFEGSNPLNFKSIDPAKCKDPNFQVHVIDGAVHLWSNCD